MAEERLIVEVYEYRNDNPVMPRFQYTSCPVSNKKKKLGEVIEDGFSKVNKKNRNDDNKNTILTALGKAGFDRIEVELHPERNGEEPFIELTNLKLSSLSDANAMVSHGNEERIPFEKYQFMDGNDTTILKDGQRITLVYSYNDEQEDEPAGEFGSFGMVKAKPNVEISMNITYLVI